MDRGKLLGDYAETAFAGVVPGSLFFLIVCFSSESKIYFENIKKTTCTYLESCLLEHHFHFLAHYVFGTQSLLRKVFCLFIVRE